LAHPLGRALEKNAHAARPEAEIYLSFVPIAVPAPPQLPTFPKAKAPADGRGFRNSEMLSFAQ
jgi:hypothetical protein